MHYPVFVSQVWPQYDNLCYDNTELKMQKSLILIEHFKKNF